MNESEAAGALLTLAEIGIGLVGFAGLVLAVTRRTSTMSRNEVVQLRELVRAGLGAAALALVPVGALLLGATGPTLWRTASGVHVLIVVGGAFPVVAYEVRRILPEDREPTLQAVTYGFGAVCVLVQGSNLIGWPFPASPGTYFLGVLVPLGAAAVYFTRLLFSRLL